LLIFFFIVILIFLHFYDELLIEQINYIEQQEDILDKPVKESEFINYLNHQDSYDLFKENKHDYDSDPMHEMFYDKTILDTSKSKEISDIFDSDEPIGLERLFYEQVPFTNFFVYDQMYYETKNAEAFINNKAIKVKEIGRLLVMPELLEILRNNINMEMQPSLNEDMQELLIQIRDSNGLNINKVNNANSDDSINSDVIKAIINKSDVSIYSIGENGDTFRE
jgi:hypothetical protein